MIETSIILSYHGDSPGGTGCFKLCAQHRKFGSWCSITNRRSFWKSRQLSVSDAPGTQLEASCATQFSNDRLNPFCFYPIVFVLASWAIVSGMPMALAQDQVVLQTEGQSGRIVMSCRIVDYTGEKITVQLKTGSDPKTYPAEQVFEVRTDWLPAHEQGRKLLAEGKLDEASRSLQAALTEEQRKWVRREILALLVRVAIGHGFRVLAGTRFLTLIENDRTSRHFGLIPLVWAPEPPTSTAIVQARQWMTAESDVARLLGASLLLDDGQLSGTAISELQTLQRATDERVRLLAQAQTWRGKLKTLDVSDLELQRWDSRIRELPASLRGGPSYLLGRGWAMRRDHERAATAFLWLPLMDDTDPRLAARAGVEAASSLKRIGKNEEARRLLDEIARRFPETEFGESAKSSR